MAGLAEKFPGDIAIVCSNCHRMLHKSGRTVKQLSDIIKRNLKLVFFFFVIVTPVSPKSLLLILFGSCGVFSL